MKKVIAWLLCSCIALMCGCDSVTDVNIQSGETSSEGQAVSQTQKAESYKMAYTAGQSLNPLITESSINLYLCGLMFDGLVCLDNSMAATNVLAESIVMNETNTLCTVKIKKGMKFSDGTEISSLDVAATVNTVKALPKSYYYSWMKNVAKVTVSEAYEAVFTLIKPDPNFVSLLAFPIVKGGSADSTSFVGSGRYIPKYGEGVTLEANANWYGNECVMKKIVLVDVDNTDSIRYELDRQNIDFMYTESNVETLGAVAVKNVTVNNAVMLGYNSTKKYFASGEMRRAFDLILDKEALADGDSTGAQAANIPLNPKLDILDGIDTSITSSLSIKQIAEGLGFTRRDEIGYYYLDEEEKKYFTLKLIYIESDVSRKGQISLIKAAYEKEGILLEAVPYISKEEFLTAIGSRDYDLCYCEMKFNNNSDLSPLFVGELSSFFTLTENSSYRVYEMYLSGQKALSDFTAAYISEMPVSVLYFRNGRVMYSRNFDADVKAGPAFIFNNAEEWVLYN